MKALGATHHFVSTLDDIAWLTNLRGADVQYNPVFLAHLLIDGERATLFIGEGKIGPALKARLEADGIALAPYARAAAALACAAVRRDAADRSTPHHARPAAVGGARRHA